MQEVESQARRDHTRINERVDSVSVEMDKMFRRMDQRLDEMESSLVRLGLVEKHLKDEMRKLRNASQPSFLSESELETLQDAAEDRSEDDMEVETTAPRERSGFARFTDSALILKAAGTLEVIVRGLKFAGNNVQKKERAQ